MLAEKDFRRLRDLLYDTCWIDLNESKKDLVKARLGKRLRQLGLADLGQYISRVLADGSGAEMTELINTLTTNLTFFFRESDHLWFLGEHLAQRLRDGAARSRSLKIWSAGCSSGEEAYSIAIHLTEALSELEHQGLSILATDVSARMVEAAKTGVFAAGKFKDMPALLRDRYFDFVAPADGKTEKRYRAKPELQRMIRFARHNLAGAWPMKGPFDAVFCRNVMIYFDKKAQQELVTRFYEILRPGGVLIVGHAESLTGVRHGFIYVRPSVYVKPEV